MASPLRNFTVNAKKPIRIHPYRCVKAKFNEISQHTDKSVYKMPELTFEDNLVQTITMIPKL